VPARILHSTAQPFRASCGKPQGQRL
jgi:hypothetical protein